MSTRREFLRYMTVMAAAARALGAEAGPVSDLDPRGHIHLPIGIPNTLDTVKTFVEAEGNFSPGIGTYGIYFWLYDADTGELHAPTMSAVPCEHGLDPPGLLIPFSRWMVGSVEVTTRVCEVKVSDGFVVAARASIRNTGNRNRKVRLFLTLRPLGPAGWAVHKLDVDLSGDLLLVDGRTALVSNSSPSAAGASMLDDVGGFAARGETPPRRSAASAAGDCSGSLRFDLELAPSGERTFGFVCPVLPGRRAARHRWIDLKEDAMVDAAELNPEQEGELQPDFGSTFYRGLNSGDLFQEAESYWRALSRSVAIETPDPHWGECLSAILGHASLCLNEGAPDVAVANYNVFNRDGMYLTNIMQKSGLHRFSVASLHYFVDHPFNGRAEPEADNPGQVLWSMAEEYRYGNNRQWLHQIYPMARQIAEMIAYCRTTPEPHWVSPNSLVFGSALPTASRHELKPGSCDGFHPEYSEAFDVAGLRAAAYLADEVGNRNDAEVWRSLAERLFAEYDKKFGVDLRANEYGNYSVLWPCRLYPLGGNKGTEQFRTVGPQAPSSWRYFALATAHQGLLAGNREAGYQTIATHLAEPLMRGWYVLDEFQGGVGSPSGEFRWPALRTKWPRDSDKPGNNLSIAMPHGWAVAELWLLMRDCLVFEDEGALVLFAGVPPEWLKSPSPIRCSGLATYFGSCGFDYRAVSNHEGQLSLTGSARPPHGFRLRLPGGFSAESGQRVSNGDWLLGPETKTLKIRFE